MVLKKSAIVIHRLLWAALFIALVLVASYVSIGRYYIDYVEQYQDQLVSRLVDMSGVPLTVGKFYGRWSKLSPYLSFEDVSLNSREDPDQSVLYFPKAHFQLNPLMSLLSGKLRVDRLESEGIRVALEEFEPGQWRLASYTFKSGGKTDVDALLDSLLAVDVIQFVDGQLSLQYFGGAKADLIVHDLTLRRDDDFRRVKLSAAFKQDAEPLNIIIEATGDPRDLDEFSARAHIDFNAIDFVDQLPLLEGRGLSLQEAIVDSEIWIDWQPGTAIEVQGWITAPVFDVGAISGKTLPVIEDLELVFRMEKNREHDWYLWAPTLKASWKGHPFLFEKLYLEKKNDQRFLMMPALDLKDFVADVLALDVLEGRALSALTQLNPQGSLEKLKIQLPYTLDNNRMKLTDDFNLSAELKRVSVEAWQGAPAATGVDGYLYVDAKQGRVELSSTDFSMFFPSIYRLPMQFNSARGIVGWQIEPDRVRVGSGPLEVTAVEHGPATGVFSLDLPNKAAIGPQTMFLAVGIQDTSASVRNKFIPFVVDKGLRTWLDESVLAGQIERGSFIYNGALSNLSESPPSVQLALDVTDGELRFSEDWPALKELQARVLVDDSFVDVRGPTAKMFDLQATDVVVNSQTLRALHSRDLGGSWLTVDAKIQGPAASGLRVVTSSVLREMVGSSFDHWRLDGSIDATLQLGVPLGNDAFEPEINFASQLSDSVLHIDDFNLLFSGINGPLNYSSSAGLSSPAISAEFFGFDQVLKVQQSEDGAVLIDMEGNVSAKSVSEWTGQPALVFFEGVAKAKAHLAIKGEGSYLSVNSDLNGIAIDLPAPYGKPVKQPSSLSVYLPIGTEDPLLELEYNDSLGMQLQLKGRQFERGLLWLGDRVTPVPQPGSLLVSGQVSELELEGFDRLLEMYLDEQDRLSARQQNDAEVDLQEVGVESEPVELVVRNLYVEKLDVYGMGFDRSLLDVEHINSGWQLSVLNQVVDGSIVFPDDKELLPYLHLERLYLSSSESEEALPSIDPRQLLDLEVTIDKLYMEAEEWGGIHFEMRSGDYALQVVDIYGEMRGMRIGSQMRPASLVWLRGEYGDTTSIAGELYFDDLDDVAKRWGSDSILTSKEGRIDFAMSWPSTPMEWQLVSTTGRFGLGMVDGQFVKSSDAAEGAMKLVGVFNLTNILRRLRFDFTDVYKSGISYDEVLGQFEMSEGVMQITDTLTIKTPSSLFRIRGNTNVVEEQLDMTLIATLPVANNLPWIAALAGGLPAAAGAYVASKIFEDQFQKLSSAVYSVEGSWSEPEIEFVRVFGDKGKNDDK